MTRPAEAAHLVNRFAFSLFLFKCQERELRLFSDLQVPPRLFIFLTHYARKAIVIVTLQSQTQCVSEASGSLVKPGRWAPPKFLRF